MKEILDIFNESKNPEYLDSQFDEIHPNKNVLFINPQMNGRHFYKYILPYISMWELNRWGTAITNLDKYKPNREYEEVDIPLTSRQILWADYIVFPFGVQGLKELYEQIRAINPDIRIVFNVDFNYYKLSKLHPSYKIFNSKGAVDRIEDNIFFSDLTIVTNPQLSDVLIDKFSNELKEGKYQSKISRVQIGVLPLVIDDELVMENVEINLPPLNDAEKQILRIGIIATNYTWEDLLSYKPLFEEVQKKHGKIVKFIVLGFNGVDYKTQKSCFPENFEFEYVKPCTIVHYFKRIRNMHLDLMFVPLRKNEFNVTSENYNKYIEAGMFKIPVMVIDIFPYNEIIRNGYNGVILEKKKQFSEKIEFFLKNRDELKRMGVNANEAIYQNFIYNKENIDLIDEIYTVSETIGTSESTDAENSQPVDEDIPSKENKPNEENEDDFIDENVADEKEEEQKEEVEPKKDEKEVDNDEKKTDI